MSAHRRMPRALLLVLSMVMASEGAARGPDASPPRSEPARLRRSDTGDPHHLGVLEPAADADSVVIVVYGDNRPALRMQVHSRTFRFWRDRAPKGLARIPAILLGSPLFLLEAIVPTLDGPRDVLTLFTRSPRAGGEQAVLEAIQSQGQVSAVISTGDVVQDGREAGQWERFSARIRPLRERMPYLAAPGNHEHIETTAGRGHWDEALAAPARADRYWWTFDLPGRLARFVILDSNVLANVGGRYPDSLAAVLSDEQLAWADAALAGEYRYRFVVLHHPLVSAGHYESDWAAAASASRRERLLRLCRERAVTAILAGHEHLYQRVFLTDDRGGGTWHVTTGGGGAPLYTVHPDRAPRTDTALTAAGLSIASEETFARSRYHFCRLVLARDSSPPVLATFEVAGTGTSRCMDRLELRPPGRSP